MSKVDIAEIESSPGDTLAIKKLLKRMRPAMLSAMRKQAEFKRLGIRSEIKQGFDEKTGKYAVVVIPNKVDVAIYKKKMGV